jgi:hypothetical protein
LDQFYNQITCQKGTGVNPASPIDDVHFLFFLLQAMFFLFFSAGHLSIPSQERPEKFLPVWCTTQFLVLNGKGSFLRQVGDASRYTNSAEGS